MFFEAIRAALRILVFRAGPEDFPFDPSARLNLQVLLFSTLAFTAYFAVLTPPLAALLGGLTSVGAFSLMTRITLKLRKLDNRVPQTLNALLLTNSLLTLAMVSPMLTLGPILREFYEQLAQNPELLQNPDKLPQFPAAPSLLLDLLFIWQLAVCSRIFGRSTDTGVFGGVSILLIGVFSLIMLMTLVRGLGTILGG